MADLAPDHDLLKAVRTALLATPSIAQLVGDRIFDRAPETAMDGADVEHPYISYSTIDELPDRADCSDAVEITIQIDVWSLGSDHAYSSAECRSLSEAVRRALDDVELPLESNALVYLSFERKRVLRDPDGITNHGVVQFTASVETP